MGRAAPSLGWVVLLAGLVCVAVGAVAILTASIQGMQLQPGTSLVDGYWVGRLPWMDVGTWLVPLGGIAAGGAAVAIWSSRSGWAVRLSSLAALAVIGFWTFVTLAVDMAPHVAPSGRFSSPSLATAVYSNPAQTLILLLLPAAVLVALALPTRRPRR